jgi:hypothetical protein
MKGLRAALLVLLLAMLSVTETQQRVRAQDTATPVVSPATIDRTAFANPPSDVRPAIRWWWPGGDVTNAELARELSQMQAAGFGSAEIQSFAVGLPAGASGAVPTYGSPEWFDRVGFALDRARELGMTLDLTVGSSWPMAATDIPDSQSLKQLTVTAQFVQGPTVFDAAVPAAVEPLGSPLGSALLQFASTYDSTKMRLLTVLAGKRADNQTQDETGGAPALDDLPNLPPTVYIESGSIITLTPYLTAGGRLQWPVPDGNWMIFALYQGPTGSKPFYDAYSGNARVIDHFNREAVLANVQALADAATSRFGSHVGTTLRSFFIDSLELRTELYWTDDLLDEFATRRGYRLEAFLPVLFRPLAADAYLNKVYPNAPASYDVRVVGRRVRQDYDHTIGALLAERFFEPLQEWSRTSGINVRVQAHGAPVDLLTAYGTASVPETEGLYAGGNPAFLKIAASAAKAAGRPVVSSEILAFKHGATTPARILQESNKHLVNGVNQLVLHGFPYVYDAGFPFPGWMPFNSPYMPARDIIGTFGSHLNDRNPIWPHMRHVTDYLARAQLVLRSGSAAADIAVYSGTLGYPDDGALRLAVPEALLAAGYSFDYVNADLLRSASVDAGSLRVNNNRYKTLIVPSGSAITVATANRLKSLADGGVKLILVGEMPQEGIGLLDLVNDGDADVRSRLEALRDGQAVSVEETAGLASALSTSVGIRPALQFDGAPGRVSFAHRTSDTADYYFLTSDAASAFDVNVTFPNRHARIPEIFDLHTGKIFPAPMYTNNGLESTLLLHFEPGSAIVVGFDREGTAIHLDTGSSLPGVYRDEDGQLAGLADAPGSYMAVINGGISQIVTAQGPTLKSIGLTTWDIVAGTRDAQGANSTEAFTRSALFDLSSLGTYSGNARYTAFLDFANLDPAYRRADVRLLLDLGQLTTVAQVRVNGSPAKTLISAPYTIDVSEYLIGGLNKFEVTVATSPGEAPAGLLGPVTLVPRYRLVVPGFRPLQTSMVVTPQNFPNNTNEDMLAAVGRAGDLVNHVNFQWFWKTPPNAASPEGGAVVECPQVSTWVDEARRRNLTVTLQFQSFYSEVKSSYGAALDSSGGYSNLMPNVRVASPVAPFDTASFADPTLVDAYLSQIRCLAELRPEYLVLGPEVNFIHIFNPREWAHFVPVYQRAYEVAKTVSPSTQVGMSFQYDGLRHDRLMNGDDWSVVKTGPRDFVAFTTYYGFSDDRNAEFPDPAMIPDDYYALIRQVLGPDVPVIFTEVGWSSFFDNGLETQAAFVRRLPALLAGAKPDNITWALQHDVQYFEGPGSSLNQSGLLTPSGDPKPSWEQAMAFKREGVIVGVEPRVFAPSPMPFSVTAGPALFPQSFSKETGFQAIGTASEVGGHVSLQFAWRDQITKQVWNCEDIRPYVEETQRRGLRYTLQFNTFAALPATTPGGSPNVLLLNPVDPPTSDSDTGPSFANSNIRDAYYEQIACLATMKPDYLVLGPELNFLVAARYDEFQRFSSVYRVAYDLVKSISPDTQVGSSWQYDALRPNLAAGIGETYIEDLGPQDFIGLTTYFGYSASNAATYPTPLSVPLDYYGFVRPRFGTKPVVFTEVGWSSANSGGLTNQVWFLNRLLLLFNSLKPANVIWAMQHDVLGYFPGEIAALNDMGLRNNDGSAKPAWDAVRWLNSTGLYIDAEVPQP